MTQHIIALLRLDKPAGWWLLYWPCAWGLALAGEVHVLAYLKYMAGAVLLRGAGCIVNDLLDRDLDRKVARTKTRPLASGALSGKQAFAILACVLALGLLIFVTLSFTAMVLAGIAAIISAFYPLAKRVTWWPQLVLGICFNSGILIAYADVMDGLSWGALLLYLGGIFWTLGYDTIYGHQDKTDDALIGVKSLSLYLGDKTKIALWIFYSLSSILWLVASPSLFWLLVFFLFADQIRRVELDNPQSCMNMFKLNAYVVGGLTWFLLMIGNM